jgi:excisionase family DNA binding protein
MEQLELPHGPSTTWKRALGANHETEAFVDVVQAAEFVKYNRKTVLRLAREGSIPAHPLTGSKRRKWRFLISELDAWARGKVNSTSDPCQNSRRK